MAPDLTTESLWLCNLSPVDRSLVLLEPDEPRLRSERKERNLATNDSVDDPLLKRGRSVGKHAAVHETLASTGYHSTNT
ncbi:MAG: hypothetical protein LQ340_005575 [Diploschistes diacapsis]|nr:MAG: hypothetical protein LQ340_005575 [Diploschistes diacapsis]